MPRIQERFPMTDFASEKPGSAPSITAAAAPSTVPVKRIVGALVALSLAGGALTYYLHARHLEDTDDAQIDGEITNISARVSGTIVAVNVSDNQTVKAGDVIAELDPTDYEVAVAQARAVLAQAEAVFQAENPSVSMTETTNQTSLSSAEADVSSTESGLVAASRDIAQLTAQLELARANAKNAEVERERADKLGATGSISQAEIDRLRTTADASEANVAAVSAGLAGAQARLSQAQSRITSARSHVTELRANAPRQLDVRRASVGAREAAVALARAQLRQAELNLGYVKIVAPVNGIVGRKAVSLGDRVQPGQQLAAISRVEELWVTANFRETQIRDMRVGQPVAVKVDALELDLHGTVESIGGATGSRFSLFPPENASGNYVKVVQRIPVRLHIEPGQPGTDRLRPGMSVEPEVTVR
jgi:membrane fusion protein, multidrug efflux system